MYLKSLTAKGFKSFASTTTLEFEPGITCVVGPNGSGKSNVVDAIAWVMGEQGAKTLRGGKMDDVIFAGTSERGALGRAEVSLTIDNTDGALPIDYTEVTISRTLFRSGGSEYAINGESCRLLDIQELLSDSGIGREMHVIVGQGRLDNILHATPEDRRGFIEEAAGVLKHRKRKEKALRKLDAMSMNLTRVQDLTAELRRQLKPLGRQAEVARRAQVIQADVRDSHLRLLADDLSQALDRLNEDENREATIRDRRAQVEHDLEHARKSEADLQIELETNAPKTNQVNDTHVRLTALRERFIGLTNLAAERTRIADESGEQLTLDPEQLDAQAQEARANHSSAMRDVESAEQALAAASEVRSEAEAVLAQAREADRNANTFLAERRELQLRLESNLEATSSTSESKMAELQRIGQELVEAQARRDEFASVLAELEASAPADEGNVIDLEEAVARAKSDVARHEEEHNSLKNELEESRRAEAGVSARIEALELSNVSTDGIAALSNSSAQVVGLISDHLRVEPGFERAVEAALAQVLGDEAIAVESVDDAVVALRHLNGTQSGRTSILVLEPSSDSSGEIGPAPAGSRFLLDVIGQVESGSGLGARLTSAVRAALKSIVVTDDLDASAGVVASDARLTAVTRQGEVLSRSRAIGGQPALSRIELINALESARLDLTSISATCDSLESRVAVVADALESSKSREVEAQVEFDRISGANREHSQESKVAATRLASAQGESDRLEKSVLLAQTKADESKENESAAKSKLQVFLAEVESNPISVLPENALEEHRAVLAQSRQDEVEAQLEARSAQERAASFERRAEELDRAAQAEREAIEQAKIARARRQRQAQIASQVLGVANKCSVVVDDALRESTTVRDELKKLRESSDIQLRELRVQLNDLQSTLNELTSAVHQDELVRTEQRAKIEQIEQKVLEDFGIERDDLVAEYGPSQLVPPSLRAPGDEVVEGEPEPEAYPFVREEQEKRLKLAQKSMALLGKVNPLALEEFSAMEERHTFLTAQLDDLKRGRDDLLDIVADVDARVEQVFGEAFADVQREFETVFSTLFPGGEGRLVLTEPDDLLNTGIEVEARPAGKRVKRLSLLSGGERSLTAVAFLVALFKARPSPFYLLDEVEAALDDVNLGRLIGLLEELRATSQLLVITHQKKTMEIADALYGVTMKDGVTQLISQRIRELVPA